jgi:hypothetical protein
MVIRYKTKKPRITSGAFLFLLRKNYFFFLEVSFAIFLEVSAIFILPVSFLEVSVAILAIEVSAFFEVSLSEEPAEPLPLQAAKETAIANAKAPIFSVFFMLIFLSD